MSDIIKTKIKFLNEEDKFFIFNKVFRSAHSISRKQEKKFLLGYDNNLIIYSDAEFVKELFKLDNIKRLYSGNAFLTQNEKILNEDYFLERVNNKTVNASKKLNDKRAFLKSKNLSDEEIEQTLNFHRENLNKKENDIIYFIAIKNNKKIPIFARKKYGNIFPFETNTYGLKRNI